MQTSLVSLGDLIAALFEEFEAEYGDRELAALATDVEINELLAVRGDDGTRPVERTLAA